MLAQTFGRRPKGWMGPWIAETAVTPDLLKEAGYDFVMDWPADDQPFWMRTRSGPLLSVPYPIEINDSPAMLTRMQSAADFAQMIMDELLPQIRSVHTPKRFLAAAALAGVLLIVLATRLAA